ncbi:MAG: N-6 DNA methylase [Gemmataceae bacterium]
MRGGSAWWCCTGCCSGAASEGVIRKKLVEANLLDAVIGLPVNLFYGTGIPAAILVFRKHKSDATVVFIDASQEFEAGTNQNYLRAEHLDKIVATYKAARACRSTPTSPTSRRSRRTTST